MKIDILTVIGSPMGVTEKTIYGDGVQLGVGGAELSLLTMCRAWTEKGYDVTLYNNPRHLGESCFAQRPQIEFQEGEDRDILLYFRGPNDYGIRAKGKKVWWSCDQYTTGDYKKLAGECEETVVISPFHGSYFNKTYGINKTTVIDIPVREYDYAGLDFKSDGKQVLFCSVPDRGLDQLATIWAEVTKKVPDAHLHITSDWRLWNAELPISMVAGYRLKFAEFNNVTYHSLINRNDLVKLQMQSDIHLYPCIYDELFCISVAETQYAGCYPITTPTGALSTTNMGTMGGLGELAEYAIHMLQHPEILSVAQKKVKAEAQERFSIEEAIKQWDHVFGE